MLQLNIFFAPTKGVKPDVIKKQNVEYPFHDKSMTMEKLKELIIHFWPDRKDILVIKVFKTNCDDDWMIQYSQNIPQYMFTNRKITYVYRKDKICYKVENLVFYRDYLGGGQYGEIHIGYSDDTITVLNNCMN